MRKFIIKTHEKETREYIYHVECVDEDIARHVVAIARIDPKLLNNVARVNPQKIVKQFNKFRVVSMKEDRTKG